MRSESKASRQPSPEASPERTSAHPNQDRQARKARLSRGHGRDHQGGSRGERERLLRAAIVDQSALRLVPTRVSRHPGIRLLGLTGYASIATAVQAVKLGDNELIGETGQRDGFGRSPD